MIASGEQVRLFTSHIISSVTISSVVGVAVVISGTHVHSGHPLFAGQVADTVPAAHSQASRAAQQRHVTQPSASVTSTFTASGLHLQSREAGQGGDVTVCLAVVVGTWVTPSVVAVVAR